MDRFDAILKQKATDEEIALYYFQEKDCTIFGQGLAILERTNSILQIFGCICGQFEAKTIPIKTTFIIPTLEDTFDINCKFASTQSAQITSEAI